MISDVSAMISGIFPVNPVLLFMQIPFTLFPACSHLQGSSSFPESILNPFDCTTELCAGSHTTLNSFSTADWWLTSLNLIGIPGCSSFPIAANSVTHFNFCSSVQLYKPDDCCNGNSLIQVLAFCISWVFLLAH